MTLLKNFSLEIIVIIIIIDVAQQKWVCRAKFFCTLVHAVLFTTPWVGKSDGVVSQEVYSRTRYW